MTSQTPYHTYLQEAMNRAKFDVYMPINVAKVNTDWQMCAL